MAPWQPRKLEVPGLRGRGVCAAITVAVDEPSKIRLETKIATTHRDTLSDASEKVNLYYKHFTGGMLTEEKLISPYGGFIQTVPANFTYPSLTYYAPDDIIYSRKEATNTRSLSYFAILFSKHFRHFILI